MKKYTTVRILKDTNDKLDAMTMSLSTKTRRVTKISLLARIVDMTYGDILKKIENRALIIYLTGLEKVSVKKVLQE